MGRGRGKVILLGEHAVVHGVPAIAAGIERGVEAEASPASRNLLSIAPWNVEVFPDASGEPLARAWAIARSGYPEDPPWHVRARVDLPSGAGLGCSAAIGVAVYDALDQAVGRSRSRSDLAQAAYAWEQVFHGNPSGVDNTMSAVGGVALFRRGDPLQPIDAKKPLYLAVGYSGRSPSTKAMVASVARQRHEEPERVLQAFQAIEVLVRNAKLAIEGGDHVALGQLLDLNHTILSSLMLCTTKLDRMCQAAREAGALGAKLTGGGGGGCMFALAATKKDAVRVCEVLGESAFVAEVKA